MQLIYKYKDDPNAPTITYDGKKVDIFSLALTIMHMLFGLHPFSEPTNSKMVLPYETNKQYQKYKNIPDEYWNDMQAVYI